MSVHMTEAEARRAGLITTPTTRKRQTEPRAGAMSRCRCGETFTTTAAEDRHVAEGHNRFESVLEVAS